MVIDILKDKKDHMIIDNLLSNKCTKPGCTARRRFSGLCEKHYWEMVGGSPEPICVPKYAGKFCLPDEHGFCFFLREKPNCIHRFFMRILLGFRWYDFI